MDNSQEKIQGSVERVTFHNPENGYSVLRITTRGHREPLTLVGHIASISPGEFVEAEGNWMRHPEFGLQFKADYVKTVHPATLEGIEKYLGSGMVKGIGPHFAKLLVQKFGLKVFEIIEMNPQKLKSVQGIGPVRTAKILAAWKEQKVVKDIMVFLQSHGVSTLRAVRIYKTYGQDAVSKVKANPYLLARDIHGIGFKSADQIASNLGIPKDSALRAGAGIHYVLSERVSDGHCAYPENQLIEESAALLEINREIVEQALSKEIEEDHLIKERIEGEACLFPPNLFKAENEVAKMLKALSLGPPPWAPFEQDKALSWVEKHLSLQLAPLQREAVLKAVSSKILVITGGPGTGKTTLTRALVSILSAKKVNIALCSPTGRAAKRMSECTGREAKTIHRLLGIDTNTGGFLHNRNNPLVVDLVILDEASMVDISLMNNFLKALPPHAALAIIGDMDQLPSVGPGCVLGSLIDSEAIPFIRLTHIFRQAAESQIILNAHQVNRGFLPELENRSKDSDFFFIPSENAENTTSKIIDLVKNRIPAKFGLDPVEEIQVLSPMNRGSLGTQALNFELQRVLNPEPRIKTERYGVTFAPGDKVMVTQNDYDRDVFNGDIGFIKSLDPEEHTATIDFDGREIDFDFSDMDILSLAYAATIHKSQGSEYPAVIIPIAMQHFVMLKRNLIYTGITRGKKLVVVIGQKKALAIAVKTKNQGKRWNNLSQRIKSAYGLGW